MVGNSFYQAPAQQKLYFWSCRHNCDCVIISGEPFHKLSRAFMGMIVATNPPSVRALCKCQLQLVQICIVGGALNESDGQLPYWLMITMHHI